MSTKITKSSPVSPACDALGGEVSVQAKIDETGLSLMARSRAVNACDRLLGGLIGVPAAWAEGLRMKAEYWAQRSPAGAPPILDDAAVRRLVSEECRKQINRAAVWQATVNASKALPPPESAGDEAEASELGADWLNVFTDYAEKASSERIRQLLGQVLAGEIRTPKSFSLTTLRILAEMDTDIAAAFQNVSSGRTGKNEDTVLVGDFGGKHLHKSALYFLKEIGLVQSDGFSIEVSPTSDGHGYICGDDYYIRVTYPPGYRGIINDKGFFVSFVRLTRAGTQLARLLPRDERAALSQVANCIEENVGLELCRFIDGKISELGFLETVRRPPDVA